MGVLLLTLAAFAVKGSVTISYFKYFVKREDLVGWFLLSNGFAFIAAVLITSYLAKWIGKKPLFMLALGLGGLVIVLFSFVRPADIWFMFALQIASSFIIGFNSPLVWAMFADTADHAEWRTGRRTTGLVFASAIFATKIGFAIGAWILGLILTFFGYAANINQTERSLHGIVLSMSWIPGLMLVLAALAMAAYPLNDTLMIKIEADLKERRGEIEP